jgi:pimeloyl-ACP methyl ester carboxylesterase
VSCATRPTRRRAADYLAAVYTADVSGLLSRVTAPALVLHYRADRLIPFRGGQQLAAGLPDAQLVALEGAHHLPDARDLDTITDAIVAFLDRPQPG